MSDIVKKMITAGFVDAARDFDVRWEREHNGYTRAIVTRAWNAR